MSASLVGSEMCIRDRCVLVVCCALMSLVLRELLRAQSWQSSGRVLADRRVPVSRARGTTSRGCPHSAHTDLDTSCGSPCPGCSNSWVVYGRAAHMALVASNPPVSGGH
eukprot:4408495-Alexandrium_andersonii.AAC.1